jgi:hypothetical protein
VEVTQAKGTSQAHPLLSSEDEFAGFEIYDEGSISGPEAKTPDMLPFEYARPALELGMQLETRLGVNPFKFAMARKEVYGTTGTRLRVRVFAGYDFSAADLDRSDFPAHGYAKGVPMGGDLRRAPSGRTPGFLIRALRDPDGANLDRIQVVKGCLDASGKVHEKVYNVAWGDAEKRRLASDGKLPPVGSSVNEKQATYGNSTGDPFLQTDWRDPDLDPSQQAFYYVRVLEISTPRSLAYDAKFYKLKLPSDARLSSQERAYTSPIWYSPSWWRRSR